MSRISRSIQQFLQQESAAGLILMLAALLAVVIANSPLSVFYDMLLDTPIAVQVGALRVDKPLLLWVNDGLMAVFFFLVGLELKRELLEGELSEPSQIILPAFGAVGGMLFPALFYLYFNADDAVAIKGWAIPAATDIAFALGILALLGSRVPISLKIFLTSLAIFDDIGAIVIIALFYTDQLSLISLAVAVAAIAPLMWLNKRAITRLTPYVLIGVIMWVAMLKSGVHATLAGILVAMFIPLYNQDKSYSPLKALEHDLHGTVGYVILPIFAFCNAGVPLLGLSMDQVLHPVPLGIMAGLFLGKQVGIFALCWLAIKMGLATLPNNMTWAPLYGVAVLCGVGFTMSLFIGSLAFEETGVNLLFDERLGILLGSLLSGVMGYGLLRYSLPLKSD